jgi:peptidoglycan/xylan/chitin deacetylase (PgdA/CDA1 family)
MKFERITVFRPMTAVLIALSILAVAAAVAWTLIRPSDWILRQVSTQYPGVVFRIDTDERAIALTIDDAPHPEVTPGLLRELRATGVKATFFVIGAYAEAHPELIDSIRADGHELGNHLFTDRMSALLSDDQFVDELLRTDELLHLDGPPKWCRPGSAVVTPRIVRLISKNGYTPVVGTAYPVDLYTGVDLTVAQFLDNVRPGAILVLHDGGASRQDNVQVLSELLPQLKAMGYRLLTLTELSKLGKPVAENRGKVTKARSDTETKSRPPG